ncbi:DUF2280 domain-containing protein [Acinetobacter cumulans]|uniref:DUF2280 domain-containing protein n=1 Tax=Acinetobacter TaxID=469 RepID=UPI000D1244EA|nr:MULTISPECIES: DUF2280 domain-containing protein [Acinetobacter]QCO22318.1 DUF2280 domain-containing protein [Acinetobacter cumulans]RKG36822.1 DUF2280 domain-containing protein [Acinetobacter sp. WCHAc060007]RKG50368.1 DUF2280 domain-containing protein [Acinetobacter cumulans]
MARLKKHEKAFIVRSLAQFMEPSQVAEAVKENYKIDVSRQQVECYDPTKVAGADLSQEFVDMFHEARKKYIEQPIYNIEAANDIVQLRVLSALFIKKQGNTRDAIKLSDQIQKIVKGYYEKKIEITGKDGKPIETINQNVSTESYLTAREQALNDY